MALGTTKVRMETTINDKSWVVLEVPNIERESVYLRDVLSSDEFKNSNNNLPIAIGKDVKGNNIIADLTKLPHLLVGGWICGGTSVFITSLLSSIVYHQKPEKVKIIVFDVRIAFYTFLNKFPHLMMPIITDSDKAIDMLQDLVDEVQNRYELFVSSNVRNIQEYNQLHAEDKMPYIVVVIDDLADLVAVDGEMTE